MAKGVLALFQNNPEWARKAKIIMMDGEEALEHAVAVVNESLRLSLTCRTCWFHLRQATRSIVSGRGSWASGRSAGTGAEQGGGQALRRRLSPHSLPFPRRRQSLGASPCQGFAPLVITTVHIHVASAAASGHRPSDPWRRPQRDSKRRRRGLTHWLDRWPRPAASCRSPCAPPPAPAALAPPRLLPLARAATSPALPDAAPGATRAPIRAYTPTRARLSPRPAPRTFSQEHTRASLDSFDPCCYAVPQLVSHLRV